MHLIRLICACFFLLVASSAMADDCYKSTIVSPTPFTGNHGEVFSLDDGTLWKVKYERENFQEYSPNVIICPKRGDLEINGKKLNVIHLNTR